MPDLHMRIPSPFFPILHFGSLVHCANDKDGSSLRHRWLVESSMAERRSMVIGSDLHQRVPRSVLIGSRSKISNMASKQIDLQWIEGSSGGHRPKAVACEFIITLRMESGKVHGSAWPIDNDRDRHVQEPAHQTDQTASVPPAYNEPGNRCSTF